jgi:crotonobetainyl-CoA:carnitine CoA-transferase CaiB-like acyl-CoA transferase
LQCGLLDAAPIESTSHMTATDTPRGDRQSVAFLGSIRVLLVGDGLSGMWACEILRSLGADVARLAEPGNTVDAVDPLNEALGNASTVPLSISSIRTWSYAIASPRYRRSCHSIWLRIGHI